MSLAAPSYSPIRLGKSVMAVGAIRMDVSRIAMVMATIRQRIAGRSLTAGARLPSVRSLAKTLAVSVSTVVEAGVATVARSR